MRSGTRPACRRSPSRSRWRRPAIVIASTSANGSFSISDPVLERAGLALVGVGDEVVRRATGARRRLATSVRWGTRRRRDRRARCARPRRRRRPHRSPSPCAARRSRRAPGTRRATTGSTTPAGRSSTSRRLAPSAAPTRPRPTRRRAPGAETGDSPASTTSAAGACSHSPRHGLGLTRRPDRRRLRTRCRRTRAPARGARLEREQVVEGRDAVGLGGSDDKSAADVVEAAAADPSDAVLQGVQRRQQQVAPLSVASRDPQLRVERQSRLPSTRSTASTLGARSGASVEKRRSI